MQTTGVTPYTCPQSPGTGSPMSLPDWQHPLHPNTTLLALGEGTGFQAPGQFSPRPTAHAPPFADWALGPFSVVSHRHPSPSLNLEWPGALPSKAARLLAPPFTAAAGGCLGGLTPRALPPVPLHAIVSLPPLRPSSRGPARGLLAQGGLRGLRGLPDTLRGRGALAHILNLAKGSSFHVRVQLPHPTPIPLIDRLFT